MQNLGLRSGSRNRKTHKNHTRPSSMKLMSKSAKTLKGLRKSILDFLVFPKALHGFFIPATCCFKVITRPSERLKHGFDVSKSENPMEPAEPDFRYSAQTQALTGFFGKRPVLFRERFWPEAHTLMSKKPKNCQGTCAT